MPSAMAKRNIKYAVIRCGLVATSLSLVHALFPRARGRGVIFTLHHVRPANENNTRFSPNAILSITPEFLEDAITTSLEIGLTPVHLHDLPERLADPSDQRRFVAFTLDDGYRDNAEYAAPVFGKHGIPYTIFVNPGFVERKRTMWWETLDALVGTRDRVRFDFGEHVETLNAVGPAAKYAVFDRLADFVNTCEEDLAVARIDDVARAHGIDPMEIVDRLVMTEAELRTLSRDPLVHFGNHTVNHINLRRVDEARLSQEIRASTALIESYVGSRPQSFSYPYGWTTAVGDRESAAAAAAGFAVGVTTQPGVLGPHCLENPLQMPRVSLNGLFQKKRYVEALVSGIPFKFMH